MAACESSTEPQCEATVEKSRYLAWACDEKLIPCCDVRVQYELKLLFRNYFFRVLSCLAVHFLDFWELGLSLTQKKKRETTENFRVSTPLSIPPPCLAFSKFHRHKHCLAQLPRIMFPWHITHTNTHTHIRTHCSTTAVGSTRCWLGTQKLYKADFDIIYEQPSLFCACMLCCHEVRY